MIRSIEFKNFRMLRDTTLPLGRFTLIVGPNGSGKSTALWSFGVAVRNTPAWSTVVTVGVEKVVELRLNMQAADGGEGALITRWSRGSTEGVRFEVTKPSPQTDPNASASFLLASRVYALDAARIAAPAELRPNVELGENGANLVVVLDRLRDEHPERFEQLNGAVGEWFPEFDRILFVTPDKGMRSFALRRRGDGQGMPAENLSQGTLIGLALLTLAWLPSPPPLVGLEEPDRGLHPRLLRDVRDAIYRLAYPEQFGEEREPVQVVATTHNPYFLDLFRDHPEEIVIAEKLGEEAKFHPLAEREDIDEILGDASLGEVWYSGVLGGVPAGR